MSIFLKNILKSNDFQSYLMAFILPIFLYLIATVLTPENLAFYAVTPHPYLFLGVLFSAYYGLKFALITSPILAIEYLLLLHAQIDYQSVETIISMEYLSLPLTIIILSSLVGEFKTKSQERNKNLEENLKEQESLTDNLISKVNFLHKSSFELKKQLVNKVDTATNILHYTKGFQSLDLNELYETYLNILHEQAKVTQAHFYIYDPLKEVLTHQMSLNQIDKDRPRQTIIPSKANDPILNKAFQTKNIVHQKDLYEKEQTIIDSPYLIVCPFKSQDEIISVCLITKIPFLHFTPTNLNLINIYTQWMERSIAHSKEFDQLTKNSIFNQGLDIYTYKYFNERLEEDFDVAKRHHQPLDVLQLIFPLDEYTGQEQIHFTRKFLSTLLIKNLRKMDCVCEGAKPNEFYIILLHTKKKHINMIIDRVNNYIDNYLNQEELKELIDLKVYHASYTNQKDSDELLNDLEEVSQ